MGDENWAVGIAEYKIAKRPGKLSAYGLGSCVSAILYDPQSQVGGLAHIMLPASRLHSQVTMPGKFADTAVDVLVEEMEKAGCQRKALVAKIIGGANMFAAITQSAVPIGLRNVSATRERLQEKKIPVIAEDIGGTQGRTLFFNLDDGKVEVRKLNQPVYWV